MEAHEKDLQLQPYSERKGQLPFMLTWLSLDGRPQTKYYGSKREAQGHAEHLRGLGRKPKVWLDVTEAEY